MSVACSVVVTSITSVLVGVRIAVTTEVTSVVIIAIVVMVVTASVILLLGSGRRIIVLPTPSSVPVARLSVTVTTDVSVTCSIPPLAVMVTIFVSVTF